MTKLEEISKTGRIFAQKKEKKVRKALIPISVQGTILM
jgi:hypothetical protein